VTSPSLQLPPYILFGAAYYHEYQPYPRLETDLDLMVAAGFTVIRVGESVWSTWEPDDGVFDLDWLQPVLDAAHERGISVILGTPTYATPPWLVRKHPEIMAEKRTGQPVAYGFRQNMDYSHPAYRRYADRIVRKVVGRYADHPSVIGYQVDNEPGAELFFNHGAFEGFRAYLKANYASVAELNRRWGLTHWSLRLNDWADLWRPDGNSNQGYDLAWRRYQASLTTEFITWQADIVRSLARPEQFITTCIAYGRPGTDDLALSDALEVVATNPYYAMQDGFAKPRPTGAVQGRAQFWSRGSGAWWVTFESDLRRGDRRQPFLVTETNASSIGEMWSNFPAYDGQWRQAAWTFVARGAQMVEYWHWHTAHNGIETYWGGVLGHSLEPGRAYHEISAIGAEFAAAGDQIVNLRPDADVAFVYSSESRWAFQFQPPIALPGTTEPDRDAYDTIFGTFYRGFHDAGVQSAVVSPLDLLGDARELVERYPVLVVPALYVATNEVLDALTEYCIAGGHLVVTFRTGYVDMDGRVRHEVMPGPLRKSAGTSYLEYSNLSAPLRLVSAAGSQLSLSEDAQAIAWADGLTDEGATTLVSYAHPHFGRWAAVTTNEVGSGRLTYIGTLPDEGTVAALARWIVPNRQNGQWIELPPSATVTGATRPDGSRLVFVGNWSDTGIDVAVPLAVSDLLSDEQLSAGDSLHLGPWDIRVLIEARQTAQPSTSEGAPA
jgi:beta-galactosidase